MVLHATRGNTRKQLSLVSGESRDGDPDQPMSAGIKINLSRSLRGWDPDQANPGNDCRGFRLV